MGRIAQIVNRNGFYEIDVPGFITRNYGITSLTLYTAGWTLEDLLQDAEYHCADMTGGCWTESTNQDQKAIDKIQELWHEYQAKNRKKKAIQTLNAHLLPRGN